MHAKRRMQRPGSTQFLGLQFFLNENFKMSIFIVLTLHFLSDLAEFGISAVGVWTGNAQHTDLSETAMKHLNEDGVIKRYIAELIRYLAELELSRCGCRHHRAVGQSVRRRRAATSLDLGLLLLLGRPKAQPREHFKCLLLTLY